jgi:hypothetical protein
LSIREFSSSGRRLGTTLERNDDLQLLFSKSEPLSFEDFEFKLIFIDYLNVLSGRKKGVFSTYIFWSIRVNNYL